VIEKNESGTFTVIWRDPSRDGGAKDKRSFKTFAKYGEAKAFEDKLRTDMREGTYAAPSEHTVKEMATLYLETGHRRWKIQSYNDEKGHVEKYINPSLGHRKMTEIKFAEIERAGGKWTETLGASSVNKVYATLNKIYKFARKHGVKFNPMPDVEKMRASTSLVELEEAAAAGTVADMGEETKDSDGVLRAIGADEVLSAIELAKLIEASTSGLEKVKHMTAVFTGLRHGELNGLRWPVVDLKRGRIFVNRSLTELKGGAILERPKTKAAYRYIKLPAELVSDLRKWKLQCPPSTHEFVFCDLLGRPMNRKTNNRALKAAMERAEIRVLSMNNLRHSFASQHLIAGTPPLEVSKLMGHSEPGVTLAVYSRWCDREQSNSEAVLAERIFKAAQAEATGSE
jgi:integrase